MVHDSCDLEDYVQSFEGFFDRKDAEGDCLVMQGIENSDILAKVDLLSPDLFLLKLFQFSPAYDHVSRLSLQSLRLHPAIIGNPAAKVNPNRSKRARDERSFGNRFILRAYTTQLRALPTHFFLFLAHLFLM